MSLNAWTGLAAPLAQQIDAALRGAPFDFEAVALALHAWQAAHDPVLASLVEQPPRFWTEIPAVPVGLFKDLPVGTVPAGAHAHVFRTSGTTGGGRGEHRLRSTHLYDTGALAWARACLPGPVDAVIALLQNPAVAPDSSLSHMVDLFPALSASGAPVRWFLGEAGLDREGLDSAVRAATGPLYVATTAFALAEWLDRDVPALPPGSVLMVTGGFKGRVHRLDGPQLYAAALQALRPAHVQTEYGMTELSSQLWGDPHGPYRAPPWLRVVAADPHTGRPLPAEAAGQLRFYDLANLDGSLGIETMDEGIVHADGSVTLLGRLAGAPARGCSLTVEEAWAKRTDP